MKAAHKLDQSIVISRPIIFEGVLKRLVGEDSADLVIDSIREEFVNSISYTKEAI
jgi:hypothetical protein